MTNPAGISLLRMFAVASALLFGSWFWGQLTYPDEPTDGEFTTEDLTVVAAARQPTLDPERAHIVYREVDYAEGASAAWYPKRESPVLAELVEEGHLPPVAERVGEEPLVLAGPDGTGNYGGIWADAVTWDGQVWPRMSRFNAATNLVRWSPSGYPIVPHVAKRWDVSDDQREWTFHLRKGMRWSDGHPFTADDFVYWYEWELIYFQSVGHPLHHTFYRLFRSGKELGELVKVDSHTVRFVFPQPNPFFLEILASASRGELFAPRHYVERFHPEFGDQEMIQEIMRRGRFTSPHQAYFEVRRDDNPAHPRINAWIYRRYKTQAPHSFVRNPYYWAVDPEGNQLPYVDQVNMEVITPNLLAIKAAAGGYPAIFRTEDLNFANYAMFMSAARERNFAVRHYYPAQRSLWTISPNITLHYKPDDPVGRQKSELLAQKEFRHALSLAINREAIIRAEYSGFGEPAQSTPGPYSPFHNERHQKAFVEHDPERANRLLDSLGLTERDRDGYRLLPDGSPMVWFLTYRGDAADGPFQFVVDDWAAVGIRTIAKQISDGLFVTIRMARTNELLVTTSMGDFIPIWDANTLVPLAAMTPYAPMYGAWFSDELNPAVEHHREDVHPPPPGHPLRRAFELYPAARTAPSREEGIRLFDELADIAAENLWTIAIASPPPAIAIVRNDFKNVPENAIRGPMFQSPLNLGVETFYFERPHVSPGAFAQLKEDLTTMEPPPVLAAVDAPDTRTVSDVLSRLMKTLLLAIFVVGVILVGKRHPYVGRRLLLFIPMLFVISVMTFIIIQAPPGNIIETRLLSLEDGTEVSQEEIDRIREQFFMDDPMPMRYLRWMGAYWFFSFSEADRGLMQGDLGLSMMDPLRPQPVNEVVGDRILLTVLLSLGTILFTWSLALPIGVYSAVRQYSVTDYVLTFIGFIGMSVPGFLLALLTMYWGGKVLGMDLTGLFSPEYEVQPEWTWGKVVDLLKHIWVPLIVLGVEGTAAMIRIMRGNLLDELRKPYVMTARAKGVRPLKLIIKYPVRVAINPFISTIGSLFPELISGGAIVSVVLGLPTIGPLMLEAFLNEDIYLAGSMLVVLSLLGILGTLVSDLLLMWLDPRIRMEGGRR